MDDSMDLQKPIPLSPNKHQMHGNGSNCVPKLLKSTRDQQSFSAESVCPKHLKESASDESKMQACSDRLWKNDTEHRFKPESQVKSKTQKIYVTEKGNILHDSEAMEHIQASRKPEADTKSPEDSKDIFISQDGEIQRGQEAIIAKVLHDIEKSCSKPSRSFTVTLKHPKVEETEQDDTKVDHETDSDTGSSVESSHKLSKENEDTHKEVHRDTAPHNGHCSSDEAQNEEENNTASNFEGADISGNDSSIANEINNQQACVQIEIDCNSSEDGYDSESSDYHRELEQNTSSTSTAGENYTLTQDDDNEHFSDTEEDDHRSLQQQNSSIIVKVNEHTKSKISSTKEVFEAKKSIASSEIRAAATDCKGISENVQLLATDTNVRGGEVRAATADTKLIDTKVKTGTVVTKVKGAEVKVATSDVKGLHAQTGASLDITTKASTTTAGRVELTGADVDIEATAEPTAQGASVKTGTASITGVQEKIKADVKATTSGTKVQAGVADVSAVKCGATAEASVEATGLDVKVGTAQISAIEVSATASASANTGTAVNIGNARVTAFDGIGARASISAQSGIDLCSVNIGLSGNTGIKASTTPNVGCVTIAPGLPKLTVGSGLLNFGFGGGVEGQSGTYAGVAIAGNPERSSRHGNAHGGNAGDSEFSSCDGGPGTSSVQGSSGLGGGVGGQSGAHAGIDTMESLEGSSRIHNECSQNTSNSEFLSHESGPGSSTGRNMQETSSAQGSLDVHVLSGPFGGSIGGASDSFTVRGNISLCSGTSHNHQRKEHARPQSHDNMEFHKHKAVKNGSSEGVKLSEQPFHLKVLQTLEYEHLKDEKDSAPLCNGQTAIHTNVMGQQLSAPECDIQLQGTEAKLQAEINQRYPCLRGSNKREVNRTVEQIKRSAIRKLHSEGKAGAHSSESSSTTPTNDSINNPPEKAKPFGPRKNIYNLRCFLMDSPKGIVTLNSGSGGNIAGFVDQDD